MFRKLSGVAVLLSLLIMTPAVKIDARTTSPSVEQEKGREQHPHIRAAIHELQEAKHELEIAAHDFGGHRKEALESTDKAIRQLQLALEYDRK